MSALERIMVVLERDPWRGAALRRAIDLARRSGAELHLCVFAHDPMIVAYGDDLEDGIRRAAVSHFIDSRMRSLSAEAVAIAEAGVRVESEVLWAPKPHQAIIARCIALKPDLVIKGAGSRHQGLRPVDWKLLRLLPSDLMLVREESPLQPRSIVAAIDVCNSQLHPEPLNKALLKSALRLARYAAAQVDLAHVLPYIPAGDLVDRKLHASYEQMVAADLAAFQSFAASQAVPADRMHALSGDAATGLLQFIDRRHADMVALGSIYRSAWDRFMLGSTAEELLGELRCDVLMVKEPEFATALTHHVDLAGWQRALEWTA